MTAPTRLLPRGELTGAAREYLRTEAGGAVLLLLATVAALVWANSPWSGSYEALWETHLSVQLGDAVIDESLRHWVNDALMTLFFLLVGLEIARELSVGEYQDRRAVVAPALAALGGLVVPAALYLLVAGGDGEAARGWGSPSPPTPPSRSASSRWSARAAPTGCASSCWHWRSWTTSRRSASSPSSTPTTSTPARSGWPRCCSWG